MARSRQSVNAISRWALEFLDCLTRRGTFILVGFFLSAAMVGFLSRRDKEHRQRANLTTPSRRYCNERVFVFTITDVFVWYEPS